MGAVRASYVLDLRFERIINPPNIYGSLGFGYCLRNQEYLVLGAGTHDVPRVNRPQADYHVWGSKHSVCTLSPAPTAGF